MNLYRITYDSGIKSFIVANGFQDVEDTWHKEPGRFEIENIELIERDIQISNN